MKIMRRIILRAVNGGLILAGLLMALLALNGCAGLSSANNNSKASAATTPATSTAPVISGVTSGSITSSSVIITWTTDLTSDSQVDYGTTTAYGQSSTLNSSLVTSHSASISGLAASTLYHFRVKSSASGQQAVSADFTFTTGAAGTPPVISAVSAGSITSSSVIITWTTNVPADSQVDYGTTTAYGQSSTLNSNLVASHSVSVSGLTASTLYHFRVKSSAAGQQAVSADFTFTTGAAATPPVISAVSAGSITSTSVVISWTTNVAADSQVDYGTTTAYGQSSALNSSLVTSHSVSISSLSSSTLYHFRVKSSASGQQAVSADFTFTTAAGALPVISGLTTSNLSSSGVTISWTTNVPTTSQVVYGLTTGYGQSSPLDSSLITSHAVTLSALSSSTLYDFQAQSLDSGSHLAVSPNSSFTTLAPQAPPPSPNDTITITETSGSAQANRPMSVARGFVQGDIPNFPQASIGSTPLLTQADVKNRWPDGSVKFAIVSFILPSLSAHGLVTVSFSNQASGNNSGYLQPSDMLAAGYNFDAQIQETGSASNTISARTMLNAGSFRYWLQGPIVTAVIVEDRTASRTYDFNSDNGSGNPLHPIFEAWFYPQTHQVEVGYTVENVWAGSTIVNSMRDQTYAFTLTSGSASPVVEFTQGSFNHISRSRWYRHFWLQNSSPLSVRIDHNLAYLAASKLIPNYDPSLVIDQTMLTTSYTGSGWGGTPPALQGGSSYLGNYPKDMNAGGAGDQIGLMPKWETMYFMTMGSDDRMLTVTLGNADLAGRIPFHYREADSGLFFDNANSVNAFGHGVSINARPQENLGIGFNSDFNDTCGGTNTKPLNLGTTTDDGWDTNGMDSSHWPEIGAIAYLITGKYYYMEEAQLAGIYMTGWSHGCAGSYRNTSAGLIDMPQPGRGNAWAFRTIAHAWLVSPDGSAEQTYFNDKIQNSVAGFEGKRGITLSDATRLAQWNFTSGALVPLGPSPLHMWSSGDPSFIEAPVRTDGFVASAWSPWEESYLYSTFGMSRDFGVANIGDILQWGANRWFHLALDTVNVNNIFLVGQYRMPTLLGSTNGWITNYADYKTAYLGNGGGLPTSWTYSWPCNYAPDDDKRYEGMATIGFLYPYTADGFSGANAWTAVHDSIWNTSGCLPADFGQMGTASNASPKWDILARH